MEAKILDITSEQYHSNAFSTVPCYSNSIGKVIINKSPQHAWMQHPLLNKNYVSEERNSFDLGSAAHAALLEGMNICAVVDHDDWRTNAAKEAREEARKAGLIPMLKKDYPALAEMVSAAHESIARCEDLGGLRLSDGKPEQTIHIIDDETQIKMRLDWLSDDRSIILDYKTTEIANPEAWIRSIHQSCADMQAALYTKGVELIAKKTPTFVFMVQEIKPPYPMYFISLSGAYFELGLQRTNSALHKWRECMRTGFWPSYPPRVMYPELPGYIEMQWQEKQQEENFDIEKVGVGPVSKEEFLFGRVR